MKSPIISVLTVSLNSVQFINRAIQSVAKQKYKNWEHIVVDGCSTDGTVDILQNYKHINWISEPDLGQSDAMNKAFKMSKGDIIVYLNADDEIGDNIFEYVANFFTSHPDEQILVGDLIQAFPDKTWVVTTPSINILEILFKFNPCRFPLNPVSYYYRRSVQEIIGEFPITNHFSMDYWFLVNVYYCFELHKTNVVLGIYHVTGQNKSLEASDRPMNSMKETKSHFLKNKHKLKVFLFLYLIFDWFYGKVRFRVPFYIDRFLKQKKCTTSI